MIERIRLTASAKNQLVNLKRKTGIEHYNALCRHALCLSLANPAPLVAEQYSFAGGLEIDWRVVSGGFEDLYVNLVSMAHPSAGSDEKEIRELLIGHIHRGLAYLNNMSLEQITEMSRI